MTPLEQDLQRDWEEAKKNMDKGDIWEGLLLLAGIGGEFSVMIGIIVGVGYAAFVLSGGLAALGLPLALPLIAKGAMMVSGEILNQYANLSRKKRKSLVKALQWLGVPITIFDFTN